MFRVFDTLLVGVCILCVNLLVVIVGTVTGWLPSLLQWLVQLIRWILEQSYRAYAAFFREINPMFRQVLNTDLEHGWIRVVASTLVSIGMVAVAALLFEWDLSHWLLGLAALHGFVVGLQWDDLDPDATFRWGVDV